jgi:hypothetical protein
MRWKGIFSGVVLFSFLFTLPVYLETEGEECSDDEITRGAITALHLLRLKEKQAFQVIQQKQKEIIEKAEAQNKKKRPKRKRRERMARRSISDDAEYRSTSLPTTAFTTYNNETALDSARGDIRMHNATITKFNISTSSSDDLNLELENDNILYQGSSDITVKSNDIINVTGRNNVIVVRHTITFQSELRFAEGAELVFVFDDKYHDAKVVFSVGDGETAFTLEPSCYLGFSGNGTVRFDENAVVEFGGTTSANKPVLDFLAHSNCTLETGTSSASKTLTFKGKGKAYWRGAASLTVADYQQVLFGATHHDTDNFDILCDNSSVISVGGTSAKVTIQKATVTVLFDKASVLHIGTNGLFEINVNGDDLARGILTSFNVDNSSIVRIYDTGRLHLSDNIDSSNISWNHKNADIPIHGDGGIVKHVSTTGTNNMEGRIPTTVTTVKTNTDNMSTSAVAAPTVAHHFVNQNPDNLANFTEFKDVSGNTQVRSPSGVVFAVETGTITHETTAGGIYHLHVTVVDSQTNQSIYIVYNTNGDIEPER